MLPIKLKLPEGFLDEEVRDGYRVTRQTKELWAVELDLLNELVGFCERNGLEIFVHYGTLIGALRHGGFIPWDDDIDLVMKREDYERLCEIADFKEPYFLQTEDRDPGFSRGFARFRNSRTTCIQEYEADLKLPYNQGVFIDIFPLNYVPDDAEQRRAFGRRMRTLRDRALQWSTFTYRPPEGGPGSGVKDRIKALTSRVFLTVLKPLKLKNPYLKQMEALAAQCKPSGKLADHWFFEPETDKYCFEAEDLARVERHRFEFLEVPIPQGYDRMLQVSYGDWRTPVMADNAHGGLITDCHVPYGEYRKKK